MVFSSRLLAGCALAGAVIAAAAVGCNLVLDNGTATYVAPADAATDGPELPLPDGGAGNDSGLFVGKNGTQCVYSAYNCALRPDGGEDIVRTGGGDDDWAVHPDAAIRDGHGDLLAGSALERASFRYGQARAFGDAGHVFAVATSNNGPGWIALGDVYGRSSLTDRLDAAIAIHDGLEPMSCLRIVDRSDPEIEPAKFVYDATERDPSVAEYVPALRANGKRSASLAFNVPGMPFRGPTIDHLPVGTKFLRLDVPTSFGSPHIDAPLWLKDAEGRYRRSVEQRPKLLFVYGIALTKTGEKRAGWMAYASLVPVASGDPVECGSD